MSLGGLGHSVSTILLSMLRDEVSRSGIPILFALLGLCTMAYVARVRGERLARFWTIAWALLLARFVWNRIWGTPFPTLESAWVAQVLRVAFGGAVLSGVLALRGEHVPHRPLMALAITAPTFGYTIDVVFNWPGLGSLVGQFTMLALLLIASVRLADAELLPALERRTTGLALAVYALAAALSPLIPDGSPAFGVSTFVAWFAQLVTITGVLATFFRLSYAREIETRAALERRLTSALGEFVAVCMHCKSVRDDSQQWQTLERYTAKKTSTRLSHGVCDNCAEQHYSDEHPIKPA
ncbi:MAG: hypothetical protein IBJ03_05270 [Gemmatimonadaceae bacterium]|nr:hypothetical protein [Gemmatimonadaceae bacterium]